MQPRNKFYQSILNQHTINGQQTTFQDVFYQQEISQQDINNKLLYQVNANSLSISTNNLTDKPNYFWYGDLLTEKQYIDDSDLQINTISASKILNAGQYKVLQGGVINPFFDLITVNSILPDVNYYCLQTLAGVVTWAMINNNNIADLAFTKLTGSLANSQISVNTIGLNKIVYGSQYQVGICDASGIQVYGLLTNNSISDLSHLKLTGSSGSANTYVLANDGSGGYQNTLISSFNPGFGAAFHVLTMNLSGSAYLWTLIGSSNIGNNQVPISKMDATSIASGNFIKSNGTPQPVWAQYITDYNIADISISLTKLKITTTQSPTVQITPQWNSNSTSNSVIEAPITKLWIGGWGSNNVYTRMNRISATEYLMQFYSDNQQTPTIYDTVGSTPCFQIGCSNIVEAVVGLSTNSYCYAKICGKSTGVNPGIQLINFFNLNSGIVEAYVAFEGTYINVSDKSVKKNIRQFDNELLTRENKKASDLLWEEFNKINLVRYNRKEEEKSEEQLDKDEIWGYISNDIKDLKYYKKACHQDPENGLIYLDKQMINHLSIQALRNKVNDQQVKINNLMQLQQTTNDILENIIQQQQIKSQPQSPIVDNKSMLQLQTKQDQHQTKIMAYQQRITALEQNVEQLQIEISSLKTFVNEQLIQK